MAPVQPDVFAIVHASVAEHVAPALAERAKADPAGTELGLASLQMVEVMIAVEEQLGCRLATDALAADTFATVSSIVAAMALSASGLSTGP